MHCQRKAMQQSLPMIDTATVQLTLQSGEIGRLANGAVTATQGGTVRVGVRVWKAICQHMGPAELVMARKTHMTMVQVVYATACTGAEAAGDFLPLSVSYAERFSAAGRTRCRPSVHAWALGGRRGGDMGYCPTDSRHASTCYYISASRHQTISFTIHKAAGLGN